MKTVVALIVLVMLTACTSSYQSEDARMAVRSTLASVQPRTRPASSIRTAACHPTSIADYKVNSQRTSSACEEAFFTAEQALGFPNAGIGHDAIFSALFLAQSICGQLKYVADTNDLHSMGQDLTKPAGTGSVEITQEMGEGLVRAAVIYICPQYKQILAR